MLGRQTQARWTRGLPQPRTAQVPPEAERPTCSSARRSAVALITRHGDRLEETIPKRQEVQQARTTRRSGNRLRR